MSDYDVLVLGSGPAGCAAAVLLARRAHRVGLIRPTEPPAGALAESIPPSARRVLEELGALAAVEAAGLHPNLGNRVWWAGQRPRREEFDADAGGFHTDRASLERVLAGVARDAGVRVHDGLRARRAREAEGGWSVTCEGRDGEVRMTAAWLVDATGRKGLLARAEREPDRSTTTLALVRRWRRPGGWSADVAHHTMVESYHEGWAWSVPLSREVRCITAMIDQRRTDLESPSPDGMLDAELDRAEHVGPLREGAEPLGDAWACPASLYTSRRFARPGLLLAGDAGSFIDPLSSFGVKKALSSGWLAGVAAHTALVDPPMATTAASFFDQREREVYRRYRAVSAEFFEAAAEAHGTPYWTERAEAARRAGTGGPVLRDSGDGTPGPGGSPGREVAPADPDRLDDTVPEAAVRRAFEEIKSRTSLQAVRGATVRIVERPTVEGHRIVLMPHLASDALPRGVRFVRGVDVGRLVEVAPGHAEVPDGWAAYNGVAPPVTLPDYLTALATAFAAGLLEHADG